MRDDDVLEIMALSKIAPGAVVHGSFSDPKDFLLSIMNNTSESLDIRKDAAKALMPFMHVKRGESGKKEKKAEAAKNAANRFALVAPPKLVSVKP